MLITKSLLNFQSDRSQKVYQFYKGSHQNLQKQATKFAKKLDISTLNLMISQMVKIQRMKFNMVLV